MAQHKKRLLLNNLAVDISAIHAYCIMRSPESKLVLILVYYFIQSYHVSVFLEKYVLLCEMVGVLNSVSQMERK